MIKRLIKRWRCYRQDVADLLLFEKGKVITSVEVRVNGRKCLFQVDTGTDITILSKCLVSMVTPSRRHVTLANGNICAMDETTVCLKIGNKVWENHRVFVSDWPSWENRKGLLGIDVMSSYREVKLDFRNMRLELVE